MHNADYAELSRNKIDPWGLLQWYLSMLYASSDAQNSSKHHTEDLLRLRARLRLDTPPVSNLNPDRCELPLGAASSS